MRRLLVTGVAAVLVLGGCSGSGDDVPRAARSTSAAGTSAASPPAPVSTVAVPRGVRLTGQGSRLPFGRPAQVVYEPTRHRGTVLRLTVHSVRQGRRADFDGFILDGAYEQKAAYYYARVSVRNVGRGDVGGVAVPLWGVDKADTLLPAVGFTRTFPPCPSRRLPGRFGPGASLTTCLVYLSPDRGALRAVSYRPSRRYDPVTWTGAVARPAPRKQP